MPLETLDAEARKTSPELLVVMPVFNEQASVRKVVREWFDEIQNWTEDFVFLAVDDGSTDQTLAMLKRLREVLGCRLEIVSRENKGHGQTCLEGYRIACGRGIPFVFQLDSDGQCNPEYFFRFWRAREQYDVIYGQRVRRLDGWRRVVASFVLKTTLLVFGGVYCVDANVPYRLMRSSILKGKIDRIPDSFFLSNVALAVLLRRERSVRQFSVPIVFRERYGGEPTVRFSKFGAKATELIAQLRALK